MSYNWLRQTRTYQLDGTSIENTVETPPPNYAYTTDYRFLASKSFPFMVPADDPQTPGQSSVVFRTETTNLDNAGEKVGQTSFSETRFTFYKDGQGDVFREVRDRRTGGCQYDPQTGDCDELFSSEWDTEPHGHDRLIGVAPDFYTVTGGLFHQFFVISKDPGDPLNPSGFPGSYRSEMLFFENGTLNGNFPESIGDYDVRRLQVRNLRNECPVDPQEKNPKFKFDVIAEPLPNTSPHYSSWLPGPLDLEVEVEDASGESVHSETLTSVALDPGAPLPDGKVATVEITFDGKNNNGDFLEEDVKVDIAVVADVPGPGNTRVTSNGDGTLFNRKCPCEEQQGELTLSHAIVMGSAGPLGVLSLAYRSLDACRAPGSMGYGWSSMGSARITEPDTGAVLYRGENGLLKRWQDDGNGNYLPIKDDNYTELDVNTGGGDATYILTFRNQSVREFNGNGRLVTERDRNGNTVTYSYTGNQLDSVSDNRGHSIHYSYTGSTGGQPTEIRANHPTTGRLTQLDYYPSSHPDYPNRLKQITDPAGRVTEFDYDQNGRLSKRTIKRSTTALDLETEYTHSFLSGRLIREVHNGDIETSHTKEDGKVTITTTPLVNGEPGPECRNQYFELDEKGRILRHVINHGGIDIIF